MHALARILNRRRLLAGALTAFATCTYHYLWQICVVIKGRGASAGALAPATQHAPAHIPNYRRLRGGAWAELLQHVFFYFTVHIYRY